MKILSVSSGTRFDQSLDLFHRSNRSIRSDERRMLFSDSLGWSAFSISRSSRSLRCAARMNMRPISAARCFSFTSK